MKKYNEEYFSVINKKTGRKIVDCSEYSDAMLMLNFDPENRTITKNKMLMGQVIDIEVPKQLPTSGITMTADSDSCISEESYKNKPGELPQIKLPQGQGEPVKV